MALHPCLGFVHLEISIHRVVPDLPYVDIFHYTVSKNAHLLVSLPISAEESLSYWEAIKLAMADQLFQNSHLPWKHELLSYHRHPVSPLLWSDKLTLFSLYSFHRTGGGRCWDGRYIKCFTFCLKNCPENLPRPATDTAKLAVTAVTRSWRGREAPVQKTPHPAAEGKLSLSCDHLSGKPSSPTDKGAACRDPSPAGRTSFTCLTSETDNKSTFQPQFTEHLLSARLKLPAGNQPDKSWPGGIYVLVVNTHGVLWPK